MPDEIKLFVDRVAALNHKVILSPENAKRVGWPSGGKIELVDEASQLRVIADMEVDPDALDIAAKIDSDLLNEIKFSSFEITIRRVDQVDIAIQGIAAKISKSFPPKPLIKIAEMVKTGQFQNQDEIIAQGPSIIPEIQRQIDALLKVSDPIPMKFHNMGLVLELIGKIKNANALAILEHYATIRSNIVEFEDFRRGAIRGIAELGTEQAIFLLKSWLNNPLFQYVTDDIKRVLPLEMSSSYLNEEVIDFYGFKVSKAEYSFLVQHQRDRRVSSFPRNGNVLAGRGPYGTPCQITFENGHVLELRSYFNDISPLIGELKWLSVLNMELNDSAKLPNQMENLVNLTSLSLKFVFSAGVSLPTGFVDFPEYFLRMPRLKIINMETERKKGKVIDELKKRGILKIGKSFNIYS